MIFICSPWLLHFNRLSNSNASILARLKLFEDSSSFAKLSVWSLEQFVLQMNCSMIFTWGGYATFAIILSFFCRSCPLETFSEIAYCFFNFGDFPNVYAVVFLDMLTWNTSKDCYCFNANETAEIYKTFIWDFFRNCILNLCKNRIIDFLKTFYNY